MASASWMSFEVLEPRRLLSGLAEAAAPGGPVVANAVAADAEAAIVACIAAMLPGSAMPGAGASAAAPVGLSFDLDGDGEVSFFDFLAAKLSFAQQAAGPADPPVPLAAGGVVVAADAGAAPPAAMRETAGEPSASAPLPMGLSAPAIIVGTHELLPDSPGQIIAIYVTGGTAVEGLNLNAQVGDGGPEAGGTPGPVITAVDIESGIFAGNNTGQDDLGSIPQVAMWSITTAEGTVAADGLLVTLTIDTTGFTGVGASWTLALGSTLNGPTDFAGLPADIADGTIIIGVPPAVDSAIRNGGQEAYDKLLSLEVTFGEDVTVPAGALTIVLDSTGEPVDLSSAAFEYDPGTRTATWDLSAAGIPVGRYTARLLADQVRDPYGMALDGDSDGRPGGDYVVPMLIAYPGDTDLDGDVDFFDFLTTKAAFGKTGDARWADGDTDGDADVDFFDYLTVKGNFGKTV